MIRQNVCSSKQSFMHVVSVLAICAHSACGQCSPNYANLTATGTCGQCSPNYANLTATGTYQEFTSPGYPANYGPDLDCMWYIRAANPSHVVKLEFLEFETEGSGYCREDYVSVYDSMPSYSTYIVTYCGSKMPEDIVGIDFLLTVKFITDSSKGNTGFRARYISGPEYSFYNYYDYYPDDSESSNSSLYFILLATLGSVVAAVIAVVISVKVYRHIKAKKNIVTSPQSRPQRRLSAARVYPREIHGDNDNHNHGNHTHYNLPPAYSDIDARPMSPPPRYTMFEINTPR